MPKAFQVDENEMRRAAEVFCQSLETLDHLLRDLETNADQLRPGWIGLGSDTFFDLFDNRIMPGMREAAKFVQTSADQAEAMARQIEQMESDFVAKVKHAETLLPRALPRIIKG